MERRECRREERIEEKITVAACEESGRGKINQKEYRVYRREEEGNKKDEEKDRRTRKAKTEK